MARTPNRPDEASKSSYVTPEGYRKLEKEAEHLWNVERPKVARAVAAAAEEGDRSENAEYIYGRKKLREIDRRLQYLGKRLKALEIVDGTPPDDGRVYFGSWVTLEDEEGEQVTYRIVGPDEFDAASGSISVESPMAKALLRKRLDDEITVRRPKGDATFTIVGVFNRKP
jgi:transcription elongation factor GreB